MEWREAHSTQSNQNQKHYNCKTSLFLFLWCLIGLSFHLLVVVQSKHSVVVAEKDRRRGDMAHVLTPKFKRNLTILRRTQLNPSHSGGSKAPVSWQVIWTKGVANLDWTKISDHLYKTSLTSRGQKPRPQDKQMSSWNQQGAMAPSLWFEKTCQKIDYPQNYITIARIQKIRYTDNPRLEMTRF